MSGPADMPVRAWCQRLELALLRATLGASLADVCEVAALLDNPPMEYLPDDWGQVRLDARDWLDQVRGALPLFSGQRTLQRAAQNMPLAKLTTPHWSEGRTA